MADARGPSLGLFGLGAVMVVLGAIVTALSSVVGFGVALSYHPDSWPDQVPWIATVAAILLASVIILVRRPTGLVLSVIAMALGVGLTGFGLYWIAADPGDTLIWASPVVLGLGLLILAFEPKEAGNALS